MKTVYLVLAARALDADWNEANHPRRTNRQFGSGGSESNLIKAAKTLSAKQSLKLGRKEYGRVTSAINTLYQARFKGAREGYLANRNCMYFFEVKGFNNYKIYKRKRLK
ncbi:MAG: hypothetical protein RR365_12655 [Bacteroides sp.]